MLTRKNPLGLLLRRKAEDAAASLPSLMLAAERIAAAVLHGDHSRRQSGSGEKFWQFREYAPGDRPQDIDWRQSGKTDRVFIRQHEWQTNQNAVLWCSHSPGMTFHSDNTLPKKTEAGNIITLALAILLTHAGENVSVLGARRKGRSEAALQNVAENLVLGKNTETLPQGGLTRNSALFLCGDFLDPLETIETNFRSHAAQSGGGFVIQILDPAEIDLPYDGRILFEGMQDKSQELLSSISPIRAEYRLRISEHIDGVKNISRSCGWHYVLHRTDKDISDTMLEIWTTLSLHTQRAGTRQR